VLRYRGSLSPTDFITLPLVVEGLQAERPDSVLQIRSIQNDAGGASVTISVEDLKDRGREVLAGTVEALRAEFLRLGSSDKERLKLQGYLDLLIDRVIPGLGAGPKQQINNFGQITAPQVIEEFVMNKGDTNINTGQAGAVGRKADVHDNVFQQNQAGGIDLPKLAEELKRLREAMKVEATGTREQDKAIGAVADAEEAASKHDEPAALRYLKSAGTWTLGIAEKVGVSLATEVLKKSMIPGP
jgi:hypothetical protein